jgi:hypothetical protein
MILGHGDSLRKKCLKSKNSMSFEDRFFIRNPQSAICSRSAGCQLKIKNGDRQPGTGNWQRALFRIPNPAFRIVLRRGFRQFQTVVGAEGDATTAVETDERFSAGVQVDGVHRTGLGASAALDAEVFPDHDSPVLPLGEGAGGTGPDARGRVAGQTVLGFKAR